MRRSLNDGRRADRAVDGRVVDRGSCAALVSRNGIYADMWRRQQEAADEVERKAAEPPATWRGASRDGAVTLPASV